MFVLLLDWLRSVIMRLPFVTTVFLALIWLNTGFAQQTPIEESHFENPSLYDDLSELINKAQTFANKNQPDSAIAYGKLALEAAKLNESDNRKIQSLLIIARGYKQRQQFSQALPYYLQVLREYEDNNPLRLSDIYFEIGNFYQSWNIPEKALEYFLTSYDLKKKAKETQVSVQVIKLIGDTYLQLKDYESALKYYGEILAIYEETENKQGVLSTLVKVSDIHAMSDQHRKALEYELRILKLNQHLGDSVGISTSLNNIGYLYKYLDEYNLALKYFKESLELNRKLGNNDDDVILLNIGVIYRSMGDKRNALKYLFEALQERVVLGQKLKLAEVYTEIANIYESNRDYDKAIAYLETALEIGRRVYNNDLLLKNYQTLSELYRKKGDSQNALKYFKLYVSLRDLFFESQRKHQKELLEKQLEVEKKEKEMRLLLVENEISELELKELQLQGEKKEADIALLTREKELQEVKLKHQQSEREKAQQQLLISQQKFESEKKDKEIKLLQKNKEIQALELSRKELEEKERQKTIELLKRDKEIQELELNRADTLRTIILLVSGVLLISLFLILRSYHLKQRANRVLEKQNEEMQRQKNEIEQSYNNVKLLSEIATEITSKLSIEKIIETAYRNISAFMDADNFGVGIYNKSKGKLEFVQAYKKGNQLPMMDYDLNQEDELAVQCFKNQKEIFVSDPQKLNDVNPSETSVQKPAALIYQPLMSKEKTIGVITVQSYKPDAYSDYHRYILGNLAVQIAIGLENASNYEEISKKTKELEKAFQDLQAAQSKLVQSEKMASLGLLTAGIAHEINNPINFVYAGVDGLKSSLEALLKVLDSYSQMDTAVDSDGISNIIEEVKTLKENIYFDETKQNIYDVVNAIREGASRTAEIVSGLRNFSRLDETELKTADIHKGIDSTLLLLNNRLKRDNVKVFKDYDQRITSINCYPGQLNQVFMNILSNAIEAIDGQGEIVIKTRAEEENLTIGIKDTGKGMTPETKKRIFDPFYSTKDLGKGTGLGLSISFGIIEKHKGKIEVNSEQGKGSEFIITLPARVSEMAVAS